MAFDLIVAGPPRPPFSTFEKGLGWKDERALPMVHICNCIIDQARRGNTKLRMWVLENVMGMADTPSGSTSSPMEEYGLGGPVA